MATGACCTRSPAVVVVVVAARLASLDARSPHDAAHATSPQLGQGCNLALIDAATLCDAIDAADALPDALAAYTRARRPALNFYQRATRWLTPLFQSDEPAFGVARDLELVYRYFPILKERSAQDAGLLSGGQQQMLAISRALMAQAPTGSPMGEAERGPEHSDLRR